MDITHITLQTFRNISGASLDFDDTPVKVILGPNGSGKTNLLEALSLLAPGTGLRRAKLGELKEQTGTPDNLTTAKSWELFFKLNTPEDSHKVGLGYKGNKRQLRIDGEDASNQAALAELGSVLWFTPEMDHLFAGSPSARRRFLDRLVFGHDPKHAFHLNRYNVHIQNRNKLLKEQPDTTWLTLEEEAAAPHGVATIRARQNYLQSLAPHLRQVGLSLTGTPEKAAETLADDELSKYLLTSWQDGRDSAKGARDIRSGRTQFGPHRVDVTGHIGHTPLPRASMGQHKKAVLTILLANAEHRVASGKTAPCLLLDEAAAHLDKENRKLLYTELLPLGGQLWLTGTERELFAELPEAQILHAEDGQFHF